MSLFAGRRRVEPYADGAPNTRRELDARRANVRALGPRCDGSLGHYSALQRDITEVRRTSDGGVRGLSGTSFARRADVVRLVRSG